MELSFRDDLYRLNDDVKNDAEPILNCNEIKCNQCKGTLLQTETATLILKTKPIKIHEYKGKNMENVNEFWKVDKLTNFENVSVSRPVDFGNNDEMKKIISILLEKQDIDLNKYQLRYLMCSGPPMDLSALFSNSATSAQKQHLQQLLSAPQICEKLIIGCAVFEGRDYTSGYLVQDRVIH